MSHERSQLKPPSIVAFPVSVGETGKAARNKFLLSGLLASSATSTNASSSRAKSILETLRQKRESLSATLSASRSRHGIPAATGLDSTTKPAPRTPKGLVLVSTTTTTTTTTTTSAMDQPSPQPEVLSTPKRFELSTQEIATIQSLKQRIVENRQAQQERWAAFKRDFDVDDSVAETADISCSSSSSSSHSSSSSQGSEEVSQMTEETPPEEAAEDSEQVLNEDEEEGETSSPTQPPTPTQATKSTSNRRQPLFSGLAKNLAKAFARPNKNKKKQIVMRVKDLKTPNISCTLLASAVLNERSVVDTSMPEGMFAPITEGTALTSMPARRSRTLRARELAARGSKSNNKNKDRTANSLKSLACSVAVQVGLTSLSMGLTILQQRAWRSLRLRARRQKQKKQGRITNSFDVASIFGGAIPRLVLGSVATTTSTAEPVSARLEI